MRTPEEELEFYGSVEMGFIDADANRIAWPIPNAIGVARRGATRRGAPGRGRSRR